MKNSYFSQIKAFGFLAFFSLFTFNGFAQVGIGTTAPNANALLDIDATITPGGFLLPRVALTGTADVAPLSAHVEGMTVYNTAAVSDVTPGYYYNDGGNWVRIGGRGDYWSTLGSAGTNAANNFIGTTDNQPLAFRVNNSERMGILTNGNVGIGGYYGDVKLNITGGTNAYGVFSTVTESGAQAIYASSNQANGLGVMATNSNTSSSTAIVGIGNNSGTYATGLSGTGIAGTAAENGYGVMGSHFNGTNVNRFGVLGTPFYGVGSNFSANNYGWMNSETEGLYTQRNNNNYAILASYDNVWDENFGIIASANGGTYNTGLLVASGETVISAHLGANSNTAQLPRGYNGSLFLQRGNATGRIFFTVGNQNYFVNSSGTGDYSEYFKTSDRTLGVGEIVAMDPNNASGVRRARPSDVSKTVGIVSIGGTRNNDNIGGTRGDDPNYVNIGLLGQVPVLVTVENGNIKPGDPLTISKKYRGRAVKATESCRIIGYALTHFPYVSGEQSYETDINGTDKLKLRDNHVMCYVNPVWYEPADENLGDGIEIIPSESAFDMIARVNLEVDAENPKKDLIRDRPKFGSNKQEMVLKNVENSSEVKLEKHQEELNSNDENVKDNN
ncbi:hypothetical protein [Aequorivita lipolytica]|uniref:Peptidase S74 domain-containing protein n=1 Tax=Aequorivita lipolytica TaxID=153267 RepID=A0A5C6YMX9_9FLAO|nr:hypothetical protein [Aequorivita lipolytica]TXD68779.1 hypothetical protein ESV24_09985 [Aequorivita lipolytica]SRX52020.1 hypothetical protein AEQU2_02008 [Aequorivita lipolytica]